MQKIVDAVKAHALAHYNDGGWDVIVEAWTDQEIAEVIGQACTVHGALQLFKPLVSIWADRQADAAVEGVDAGAQDPYLQER